jgi:hypothetical protein
MYLEGFSMGDIKKQFRPEVYSIDQFMVKPLLDSTFPQVHLLIAQPVL